MANEISKIKLPGSNTEYIVKDNSAITNITRDGTIFTATKRDGTTFTFTQQDNNTTYTLAVGTGDDANTIILRPSSGTANKITVPYATSASKIGIDFTVPTSTTQYLLTFTRQTASNNLYTLSEGIRYLYTPPGDNAPGVSSLYIGYANTPAVNTIGEIVLSTGYSGSYTRIQPSSSGGSTQIIPNINGTILNTGTTSFTQSLSSGTKIGTIKINNVSTDLYCQTNTNTTYTLSADTSNNKITLTPSSGSAQSITVPYATSAGSATKATQDGSGNTITSTYVKKSGDTMTGQLVIQGSAASKPLKVRGIAGTDGGDGTTESVLYLQYGNTTTDTVAFGSTGGGSISSNGTQYNGNAATATKATKDSDGNTITSTYVKKSGDTMTGTLKLGSSSQSSFPTVGIDIHDVRSVNFSPGAIDKGANFFFSNNTMPNTNWWSGLHVKGWTGAYAAWEIVGSAHNNDSRTTPLYVRTSNLASTWGSWRKIYDTSNPPTKSEVGLGNVDNTADANKSVSYATTSGTATGANKLNSIAAIGTASQTHAQALKTYFDANKTTIPRNVGINFYSSAYNNGANCFGYFLNGYNDNPYGGFFISHYDKAYYVGINNGNYTQNLLGRFTADPTSGQVVVTDGTTGGIKSSGYTIAKSVPSNAVFTDTNNAVTQTATTTSANYELLFSATADNTTRTEGARKTDSLKYNPSTKELTLDGTVVLNGYSRSASTDPCPSIVLKANNINTDMAVTARVWGNSEINAHDADGDRLGFVNWFKDADGSVGIAFAAQNKTTGGGNYHNTLEMRVDKTGNRAYSVTDPSAFRTAINTSTITFTKTMTAMSGTVQVWRRGNACTINIGNQVTTTGTYSKIGDINPKPLHTQHFIVAIGSRISIARVNQDGSIQFNNNTTVNANEWVIGSCTYITAD